LAIEVNYSSSREAAAFSSPVRQRGVTKYQTKAAPKVRHIPFAKLVPALWALIPF
jgi:hypothetical protein